MKNLLNALTKPSAESRPWAIWIWNGEVDRHRMAEQLDLFVQQGFGGVAIRPGRDMAPSYLSDEYFLLLGEVFERAKAGGIGVRMADDFALPWHGLFEVFAQQNTKARAQKLVMAHTEVLEAGESFEMEVDDPEKLIVLAAPDLGGKVGTSQVKQLNHTAKGGTLSWKAPKGEWRVIVLSKEWVTGPAGCYLPSVLNPRAAQFYMQHVLDRLHADYPKHFKDVFQGFVTEMPAYVPSNNGIPWDDDLITRYRSKYKKELVQTLPCLFFDAADADARHRSRVYSFISFSMYERFALPLEDWATKHKVSQWVLAPERDVLESEHILKDCFQIASVPLKHVGAQNQEGEEDGYVAARSVADSNANEFQRETVLVIGRNRHGNGANLQSLKTEVDRQALWGGSHILLDGCYMNLDQRDTIRSPYNPFWYSADVEKMKAFSDYSTLLTELVREPQWERPVAVVFPTDSVQAEFLPSDAEASERANRSVRRVINELQRHNIAFDLISDTALAGGTIRASSGEVSITASQRKGNYRAIVVPYARLIGKALWVFLEKLALKKGRIIFVDSPPEGNLDDGESKTFGARVEKFFRLRSETVHMVPSREVPGLLSEYGSIASVQVSGKPCQDIWGAHGSYRGGGDLYLFHNSAEKRDLFATLTLPEAKYVYLVDFNEPTLRELKIGATDTEAKTVSVDLSFSPLQTNVLITSSQQLVTGAAKKSRPDEFMLTKQRNYRILLKDQWQFFPDSLNILPLASWNTRVGLSRESGGFSHYLESYFESATQPETCLLVLPGNSLGVGPGTILEVFVNGTMIDRFIPGTQHDPETGEPIHIPWSGFLGDNTPKYDIKDHVIEGVNRVSIRTVGVYAHPPTVMYPPVIAGSFVISRGAKGWLIDSSRTILGYDSWTRYGFPYMSGTGTYKLDFEVPTEYDKIVLRLSRASGTVEIAVNETDLGVFNWHPIEVDITKQCSNRRNLVAVKVSNTIDNVLRMNARPSGLIGEAYLDVY